ncbi:hypothetical protein BDN71DRAFT_772816 [Pleurotus eryngii]|uniref:Uncharacterized protein n=1 Tax=Pleurotus eryngii TaxID=5323 RepID=A0A9P6A1S1_PLEER|nr:hypothetical protein BDN71DRAFT_772816 [Pleurotus eryngii]
MMHAGIDFMHITHTRQNYIERFCPPRACTNPAECDLPHLHQHWSCPMRCTAPYNGGGEEHHNSVTCTDRRDCAAQTTHHRQRQRATAFPTYLPRKPFSLTTHTVADLSYDRPEIRHLVVPLFTCGPCHRAAIASANTPGDWSHGFAAVESAIYPRTRHPCLHCAVYG